MKADERSSTDRIENPFATRRAVNAKKGFVASVPELDLRSMTGFEEEVVERHAGDPNTARLCNDIVARCLVPPGNDHREALTRVRAMTVAERDFALVMVRRLSFGDAVQADVTCPACHAKNEVDFKLSDLPMASENVAQRTIDVLSSNNMQARMRLPTAGDQEDLLDEALETAAEKRTWLIARTLLRYGDREAPFDDTFARALPSAARKALESALEAALPAADLAMDVSCAACGHSFAEPFDVAGFFLPR